MIGRFYVSLFVVLAVLAIGGCPKPNPPPVTPPDASDAAPPPPAATCSDACARVRSLGCKGAKACPKLCPRVLSQAYKNCVAAAIDCDGANACDQGSRE